MLKKVSGSHSKHKFCYFHNIFNSNHLFEIMLFTRIDLEEILLHVHNIPCNLLHCFGLVWMWICGNSRGVNVNSLLTLPNTQNVGVSLGFFQTNNPLTHPCARAHTPHKKGGKIPHHHHQKETKNPTLAHT